MKNPAKLRFDLNGKFKIMVVGDIHEKYRIDEKSEDFLRLINRALDELQPDLAILMGDIVSNGAYDSQGNRYDLTVEELRVPIFRVVEPFKKRNVPLALVFGNHDGESESGLAKEVILSLFQEYDNFLVESTPGITGVGNMNLPILSSNTDDYAYNLWLFDSGNREEGSRSYAYLQDDQIRWYEETAQNLKEKNGGAPLPALVFQHIPVMEEYELLKTSSPLNPSAVQGHGIFSDNWYVLDKSKATGHMGEGPCTPDHNSGQFESWKKQGDVLAAFFGHDHMNDFCGSVDGIMLCQSKCSGFHIYGDGLRQGVRMIVLDEDNPADIQTRMHRYREYFGTKCNSIKGYMLINDRAHGVIENTLKYVGPVVGLAALGYLGYKISKKKKNKQK
ncbi:MAG: metallophosphoesterase family protein [Clostridiales bacterium]|nr:metallophosphoesterase family protein [Clostridiales bacterium]